MAIKEKQRQFYSDLKQQEDEKVEILIRRQQEDQRFHHQQVAHPVGSLTLGFGLSLGHSDRRFETRSFS